MNAARIQSKVNYFRVLLGSLLVLSASGLKGEVVETTFPVLQIGTRMFTNVTVTTKAKDYVFFLHSQGMANIKVKELPPEILDALGYSVKPKTNNVATQWAKAAMAKVESPQVKQIEKEIQSRIPIDMKSQFGQVKALPPRVLFGVIGLTVFAYLFFSLCLSMICQKVGKPGGVMVWLPLLQIFPCLKAAGMSGWWFLGWLVPGLNIVAQLLWCINIAKARGKHVISGILLWLPVLNFFALLYLAFSGNGESKPKPAERKISLMRLEAA
jgi:hypothetical protein